MGARRTGWSSGIAQAGLTQPPSGRLLAGAGAAFGALLGGAAAGSDLVALRGSTGETGGGDADGASPGKNSSSGFSADGAGAAEG